MEHKLVLYSSAECGRCPIIKMFLDHHNLPYEEIVDGKETLMEKGFEEFPVMEIDGEFLTYKEILYWLQTNGYYSF